MLNKLLNKLRNYRVGGLLALDDVLYLLAYLGLAVLAAFGNPIPVPFLLTVGFIGLLGFYLMKATGDKIIEANEEYRAAVDAVSESHANRCRAIASYLRILATMAECGLPLTPTGIQQMRDLAKSLTNEEETQETPQEPDDQPRGGSATSDAGAPESEGLPPQA